MATSECISSKQILQCDFLNKILEVVDMKMALLEIYSLRQFENN